MSRYGWCKINLHPACYDYAKDNCDGCNIFHAYCNGYKTAEENTLRTRKWIPVTKVYKPKVDEFPNMYIEWKDATETDEIDAVKCSECGEVFDFADARNWCTQCGARMKDGGK